MSLNLKNPETERLARELARKTGESLTQAVTIAIKERLERHTADHRKSRFELLDEFSKATAPLFNGSATATELIDQLYDAETGLPK